MSTLGLEWFRGAAEMVELEAGGKSLVVYGQNGAGKSSFIDAVEHATRAGKIAHLSHEYSGTRSVLSIRNTHAPTGTFSQLHFAFGDGTTHTVDIRPDGSWSVRGNGTAHIQAWDYQRTVLRQDEVSQFIHGTKGAKYSALLPLIGLGDFETTATNLKHLAKAVSTEAGTPELKAKLDELKAKNAKVFGTATAAEILGVLQSLFAEYCAQDQVQTDEERSAAVLRAIDKRMEALTLEQTIHARLLEIASVDLDSLILTLRSAANKLVDSGEFFIVEKLEVLAATSRIVKEATEIEVMDCPACGKEVSAEAFKNHIANEQSRLEGVKKDYEALKTGRALLCDALSLVKRITALKELQPWRGEQTQAGLSDSLSYVDDLMIQTLRETIAEDDLKSIEEFLPPIISAAKKSSESAPASVKKLVDAKAEAELISELLISRTWRRTLKAANDLEAMVLRVEQEVRVEIRNRTVAVIEQITNDLKDLWKQIHPSLAIEDVHLYMPEESDKAIDIALKFHGVGQASPRLTLSEGYRNGLGLCIFLAMAMADNGKDEPLFLDDVVVSFDREHRGMIADVLNTKFKDRQVIIFTHDRDWYAELKHQLDASQWQFKMLLPFDNPSVGIRWSHTTSRFADARNHLPHRPDSAANDARKIMDSECAMIAERLELRLPYRRGERNDMREAHQFIERVIADGRKSLKRQAASGLIRDDAGLATLHTADGLLVTWGNRGSHTTNVTNAEAEKLLDSCEAALKVFACVDCGKKIWHAQVGSSRQCQCGNLRWVV
ncbi:MAG: hypothetical protein KF905_02320 [Flavobacteriales bacterium]|nr:hypothetical protein [Flavobacteriales bacterium]